ncbi:hypothetical protein L6V77_17320 [Myxococcota bacterium]|nr:hypothetical protein [Myxococcota bacterium]
MFRRMLPLTPLVLLVACLGEGAGGPGDAGPEAGRGGDAGLDGDGDVRAGGAGGHGPDARPGPAGDSGAGASGGGLVPPPPPPVTGRCAARSAAIAAATGRTLIVAPAGDGLVTVEGAQKTLREVVREASEGDTVLLEDGTYLLPEAEPGRYTGLYFTTPGVTLRSRSGNADAVVLDSAYRIHGDTTAPVTIDAPGVVIADVTIRRSIFHLVHLWARADGAVLHGLRLIDGGQQFVKSSPEDGESIDDVEVSCTRFHLTAEGRTNVWGYGPADGFTTCYTGGVDTHRAQRWAIRDSSFEGIHCDAGGAPRPAHGRAAGDRGGATYTGGLAEHAIHMWHSPDGAGHLIERNVIVDCARGIGLGMTDEVYDTVIRNNVVVSRFAASREHDVPIVIERGHDVRVDNNSVFLGDAEGYPNAIEVRWGSTTGVFVRNTLANRGLRLRDGAAATEAGNVFDAAVADFIDPAAGDLHLARCGDPRITGAGEVLDHVVDDVDGDPRGAANDVGADDCAPD